MFLLAQSRGPSGPIFFHARAGLTARVVPEILSQGSAAAITRAGEAVRGRSALATVLILVLVLPSREIVTPFAHLLLHLLDDGNFANG